MRLQCKHPYMGLLRYYYLFFLYVAFAHTGRTIRGVYQPRVPLLRRSALGWWLLPLRGDQIKEMI